MPVSLSSHDTSLQTDVEQLKVRVASTEMDLQWHVAAADATISALNARIDALAESTAAVSTTDPVKNVTICAVNARIDALAESTAAVFTTDPVTAVNVGETKDLGAQANDNDKPQRESRDQAYPLKQSTWDSLILLFLPGNHLSPIDSTVAAVLFVGNAVIQILFTMIIIFQATNLKDEMVGDKFHRDALAWRVGIGHHVNNYDPVTNTSLVTRVCTDYGAEIISQTQMDAFKAIDEYLNGNEEGLSMGTGHGPLLSFLAVLIWTACIAAELRKNWQFLSAVFKLKHGSTACVEKITAIGDRLYSLRSLSTSRRIVMVVASMTRCAIAIGLWYAGMSWLTHTIEINDVILNAVALGFVLEFDELFYHLVPREIDVVLQNLEPLPMYTRRRECTTFDPRSLILVTLLFATMSMWTVTWSERFRMQLQTSRHLFCSGNTNFIYIEDPATHVVHAATTMPDEDFKFVKLDTSRPQLFAAVLQRTSLVSEANESGNVKHLFNSLEGVQEPLYKNESASQVALLRIRDEAYGIDQVPCEDIDTTPANKNGMKSAVGFDNCTDAIEAMGCSVPVRAFCPVSCNCHTVDSGIFKRYGCTSQCDAEYDLSKAQYEAIFAKTDQECDDLQPSDDYDGRAWSFVSELQQHLFDTAYLENRDDQAVFTDLYRSRFRTQNNGWEAVDIVGVNFTNWLWSMWGTEAGADGCIWALYFEALFETNLCEDDLATGFGTVAPFCPRTCGWCHDSTKPTVETNEMAEDLRQWLGFDVITPVLAGALADAVNLNNDVCNQAGGANFSFEGSTNGAFDQVANRGLERLFTFTAQHTGSYTIRVYGDNYDTILSMWSGSSFQLLHMIDDSYGRDPCFKVDINGGDQIVLVVEGYQWNREGSFQLTVECPWFSGQQNNLCAFNPGVMENYGGAHHF